MARWGGRTGTMSAPLHQRAQQVGCGVACARNQSWCLSSEYRKILHTHKPRMLSLCYSVRNSTLQTHPSMLPKSASGPQNHPSANVALFDLALATAGVTRGQSCFPDRAPMSLLSIRREEGAASDLGSEGGTGVERRRSTMV